MLSERKIAIIGGDGRFVKAGDILSKNGYETALCGFDGYLLNIGMSTRCNNTSDAVYKAQAVVLPLPFSIDGVNVKAPYSYKDISLESILSAIGTGTVIIGGCISKSFADECFTKGITVCDYNKRKDFKTFNAIPTAEGAVAIAMSERSKTLHGSNCLVISFGCVGKALAKELASMGAKVTVALRSKTAAAEAYSMGYDIITISEMGKVISKSDVIFNAAPAKLLDAETLCFVNPETPIIDLASEPGGVDISFANKAGLRVIKALSLPGKCAPDSAGEYIATTVMNILGGDILC